MITYRKSEIPKHLLEFFEPAEMGMEKTPDEYVAGMVGVFREVWRVLRKDGVAWLNLGDSFNGSGATGGKGKQHTNQGSVQRPGNRAGWNGLKPKDLIGIPWRVAFALQSAGWYLRSDIIWAKPNPMPSSVTDRCTTSHEYIFMLTKSAKYYYNADAIKTPPSEALVKQVQDGYNGESTKDYANGGAQDASGTKARIIDNARKRIDKQRGHSRVHAGFNARWNAMTPAEQMSLGANKRDVWTVATAPFKGSHFATFPPALIEPCVLAGSKPGDILLDPFGGSGTVAGVALKHGRHAILCELNPEYAAMVPARVADILRRK